MPLNSLQLGCGDRGSMEHYQNVHSSGGNTKQGHQKPLGWEGCREGFLGETVLQMNLEKDGKR